MSPTSKKIMPLPFWVYAVLFLFFIYLFVQILQFKAEESSNLLLSGMYLIDFGVHEVSHIITNFLPSIFTAAAGSIGEISFAFLLLYATLREKSYFASVFTGLWVMLAMNSAGRYMADARSQLLPLIGPGETVQHDWHYVFGQLGWLPADTLIGASVRGLGDIIGAVALLFGLYFMYIKLTSGTRGSDSSHS
jgi:hypothetical protein